MKRSSILGALSLAVLAAVFAPACSSPDMPDDAQAARELQTTTPSTTPKAVAEPPRGPMPARTLRWRTEPLPPWKGLGIHPGEQSLSKNGGTYPRATQVANGPIVVAWDSSASGDLAIRAAASNDLGATWSDRGIAAEHPPGGNRTVGNASPLALDDGSVLCAFLSESEVGANGIWEPFLHRPAAGVLDAYYARETVNGGDQDTVVKRSLDDGKTW